MMDAIKIFLFGVDIFFVVYLIGYSSFLFLSVLWGSNRLYTERMNEKLKNSLHQDFYIPISIIVPAHNEEITVVDTVCTLLKQDYKLYEIVIVDDGSEDNTAKRLIEYFHMYKIDRPVRKRIPCKKELAVYEAKEGGIQLTLVMKENGGKADTLNMGINISRFPYFICIDADSMLQRDSLREIAKPVLEDNRTIACGGQVRVSNGVRLIDGRVQDYSLPKKIIIALQVL